ncbi:3D domain-containing protein [Cohnella candidum]|uniref:LysM peptidoglycan-binding domain-containing protein n=1 Tax=Cohnella candidum TaxID=2674991 RepID=A0A3G3K5S2_9BACL|nr:3D domain-containing protein [Cohnella candidum]AYQ75427.1 LysM peptidoglycan-binding domain-containing protein [Cohnella candidum]
MNGHWKKAGIRTAALFLGGALLLPGLTAHAATASYTAHDGDTFWLLSKKFDISVQRLMSANPNVDPLNIYDGLKMNIPTGTVKAASSKAASAKPSANDGKTVTTMAGQSLEFSKVLDIKATAYSDAPEENGWGPVDYFGNPLKLGTIAVDPKVIPFGTKVYITGYDFNGLPKGGLIATATDSGSAIKGKRIDIFIPGSRSFVSGFGFQSVKVYILK